MNFFVGVLKFGISIIAPVVKYFFFPHLFFRWQFIGLTIIFTVTFVFAQSAPMNLLYGQNERVRAVEVEIKNLQYQQQIHERTFENFEDLTYRRFEILTERVADLQSTAKAVGIAIGGLQLVILLISIWKAMKGTKEI